MPTAALQYETTVSMCIIHYTKEIDMQYKQQHVLRALSNKCITKMQIQTFLLITCKKCYTTNNTDDPHIYTICILAVSIPKMKWNTHCTFFMDVFGKPSYEYLSFISGKRGL